MRGVVGFAPPNTRMCASTGKSGRKDPNPEQVFGQAFETLMGFGFAECNYLRACAAASAISSSESGRNRKSIANHTV